MATGQRAFIGQTATELRDAILNHTPTAIHELNAAVPPRLEQIIGKALEKDREGRYQSAAKMRADLEALRPAIQVAGAKPGARRRWKVVASAAVIVAAVAAGSYWRLSYSTPTKLSVKDTIVLAEFTNATRDPVFDGTLRQALAIHLEQSPFLNVLSDQKVSSTLKLMERPANELVTGDVAREVCLRNNSRAVLAGSIAPVGEHLLVAAKAADCRSGDTLASAESEAQSRNEVLKSLQDVGTQLRGKLGESMASVRKYNVPLEEATTASLEALQSYTQARRIMITGGGADAIPYLQRAVDLDTNFALARTSLGATYFNLGQSSLARENLEKAYERRERLSQRERFYVEVDYHIIATGDLQRAIQICAEWARNYPNDYIPRNNPSDLYMRLAQYDKAEAEAIASIRLAGGNVDYSNLMRIYALEGRVQDAVAAFEQAQARGVGGVFLRQYRYYVAFLQGQESVMREQVAWAKGKPRAEDLLLSLQSDTEAYRGRLRQARKLSDQAAELAIQAGAAETAAGWRLKKALREAELGNADGVRQMGAEGLVFGGGRDIQIISALTAARAGETAHAQRAVDKLKKEFPYDTLIQGYWLPTIQAAIDLDRGNAAKATAALQSASSYELGTVKPGLFVAGPMYPVYVRGEAYLKAGQGKEAEAEFRKMLEHRSIAGNFILAALAYLQLGRAQVMMGDKAAARKSYRDFLTLWKDADPDIPIYRQAKAEYARLR